MAQHLFLQIPSYPLYTQGPLFEYSIDHCIAHQLAQIVQSDIEITVILLA